MQGLYSAATKFPLPGGRLLNPSLAFWLTFLVTVCGKNYWLCILTRIPVKGLSGCPGEQLEEGWRTELWTGGCFQGLTLVWSCALVSDG